MQTKLFHAMSRRILSITSVIIFIFLTVSLPAQDNKKEEGKTAETKAASAEEGKAASSEEEKAKKEDELARIAIVPFEDRTNTKNYQWLPESLSEAIYTSMSKEFTFKSVSPRDVKRAVYNAEQDLLKKKIKRVKKKVTSPDDEKKQEESEKDEHLLEVMKAVAKTLPAEIIIFGSYVFDDATNEIVFSVHIYLSMSDSQRELEDTRNPVDNTLFQATKVVAKSLVDEIHNMVEEAQKKMVGQKKEKEDEESKKTAGKKTAITRKIASVPVIDWAPKKFSIFIYPGLGLSPVSKSSNNQATTTEINGGLVEFRYWIFPWLGVSLAYKNHHFSNEFRDSAGNFLSSHDVETHQALAYAGVSYIFQKAMRFSIDLGAGYYFGQVRSHYANPTGGSLDYQKDIMNPAFGAKAGFAMLFLPNISLGVGISYMLLYDSPRPINTLDLIFGVGVIF